MVIKGDWYWNASFSALPGIRSFLTGTILHTLSGTPSLCRTAAMTARASTTQHPQGVLMDCSPMKNSRA